MPRPARSGRTLAQFFGSWVSSISLETTFGFVSSLMSMMRAIGNGGRPARRRPASRPRCCRREPPSSTWMTYGLPLILTGIVCCAPPPSSQQHVLTTADLRIRHARLDLARVEDHATRCSAAILERASDSATALAEDRK